MTGDPILAFTVLALVAERLFCFARWLSGWRKRQESRRRGEAALKLAEGRAEMRAAAMRLLREIDDDALSAGEAARGQQ